MSIPLLTDHNVFFITQQQQFVDDLSNKQDRRRSRNRHGKEEV